MTDTTPCAHHQFFGAREFCPDCGLSRTEVLVEACGPFLKDGETPAECIARNRRDVDGCLTMMIAERRKVEAIASRLAEAEARLVEERERWDAQHAKQHAMNTSLHERLAEWDKAAEFYLKCKADPRAVEVGAMRDAIEWFESIAVKQS